MQFLMISRRDGESIPINPLQVCFVRRVGSVTSVAMADGQSFRIHADVEAVLKAVEHAADASPGGKRTTIAAEEPAPPEGAVMAPGATPAAEDEDGGGKVAEEEKAAQKAAHDDGEPAQRAGSRR
jgi:hypothetical protein